MSPRVLIVGAGVTGREHVRAFAAIAPGACACYAPSDRNSAAVRALGVPFFSGALSDAVATFAPSHVAVVVPVEALADTTRQLLRLGLRALLVEKPGCLDSRTARALTEEAARAGARVSVAFNRRFYASTARAAEIIERSGEAIRSVAFEFSEWADQVGALEGVSAVVKSRWAVVNSLHPIDLALHRVGLPELEQTAFVRSGSLAWHPSASIMALAGVTERGVPFAGHADWDAPGRWGVEWRTPSRRFIFRPLETLLVLERGKLEPQPVPLEDDADRRFKPGFLKQAEAFLAEPASARLASLSHAARLIALAERVAGY